MAAESEKRSDRRFYEIRDAVFCDKALAAGLLAEDPTLIGVRNSVGETAIHYLAVENEMRSVEWLLDRGADVNTRNDFGDTPLMEAASLGHLELCEFLLARGADLDVRNAVDETALTKAAQSGQQRVLEMLLSRLSPDADVNDYIDGTDAEMTLRQGDDIAKLLAGRGLKGYWQRQQ